MGESLPQPQRQLRVPRGGDAAFAMPLVFPVVLLLILGAVTLASRSTSSFLVASKQSDAQAARQAAESGMNRVLRALSPFAKNVGDPYLSFLLLSNWNTGTGNWPITQLGQTAVEDRLRRCRISTRGMRTSHVVPNNSQVYARLMSDVIGTTSNGTRTLRYSIVNYTPPTLAGPSTTPFNPTGECSDFSTVSGGTAQITIEGTVEINGKQLASQRLTRTIEIDPVPLLDLADNFPLPAPPVGLRISDQGTGLGSVTSFVYREFNQDPTPVQLTNSIGVLRPQCKNCSPALANGRTNNFPLNAQGEPLDLPRFPVANNTPKPLSLNPVGSGIVKVIDDNSPADPSLNCAATRNATEISCYIQDITVSNPNNLVSPYTPRVGILRVDTSKRPINLYIEGNVGGPAAMPPSGGAPPTPAAVPNPALNDARVAIEHCVQDCSTANPIFYRHDDATNNFAVRPLWSRLRIFGSNTNTNQTFYIAAKSPSPSSPISLHGAFLWLKEGSLIYGLPTYTYDSLTNTWQLTPENAPGEILASWWVKNLDLTNQAGNVKFILPLYGNPDAMRSILPGGYLTTSGSFTEDPRFPVYPVLPRIRSIY